MIKDYIKEFDTNSEYQSYITGDPVLPNVSYIVETNGVEFNPIIPPRMDIITYEAYAKLSNTWSDETAAFGTTIKSHTFENGVGTIEFNDNVTRIGDNAFGIIGVTNDSLTSITIPDSVTSIGNNAFGRCKGLTSIDIPSSVTSIGGDAFINCTGLTSVTIGSGVTSIGNWAFSGCTGLTSIICNATTAPTIQSNTFNNVKTGGTLTVPSGSTGYDTWMGTGYAYLGYSNWTKVEQ